MADVCVHDDEGVARFISEADVDDVVLLIGIGNDDVVVHECRIPNESSAESISYVCIGLVSGIFDYKLDHDFFLPFLDNLVKRL